MSPALSNIWDIYFLHLYVNLPYNYLNKNSIKKLNAPQNLLICLLCVSSRQKASTTWAGALRVVFADVAPLWIPRTQQVLHKNVFNQLQDNMLAWTDC